MGLKTEIHIVITGKHVKAQIVYVDFQQPLVCGIALDKPENIWGAVVSTGRLARSPCIIESDPGVFFDGDACYTVFAGWGRSTDGAGHGKRCRSVNEVATAHLG